MDTNYLIGEVASLPVDERILIVDFLLRSLNQPETDIEKKWITVAQQRLIDMRNGTTESIPGEAVFQKIWNRFEQ